MLTQIQAPHTSHFRPLNILFRFFRFLIYVRFNDAFVKNFMKKVSFFNTNFQNSFKDVACYKLNGGPLNIRQNLKKGFFYLALLNKYF